MNIVVIKYNAGNVRSVLNALERIGVVPTFTDDLELISKADGIILPGQGEASSAMAYLRERHLDDAIRNAKQPLLGICIGQQLLCHHSEEGDADCLGIIDTDVKRFRPERHEQKVPVMGWNKIYDTKSALFDRIDKTDHYVYFIHSYYVPLCSETIATANYIHPYSAALHKGNFYATQFHPEKSGDVGSIILENFISICK